MVKQIRGHTEGAKLSHFDINQIRGLKHQNDDSDWVNQSINAFIKLKMIINLKFILIILIKV